MNFNELRSRYYDELATPEGCATAHQLESAINHARGVQGSSCPPAGRERLAVSNPRIQFAGEIERLANWAQDNGIATDYRRDALGEHHAQGTEHFVWFEERSVRRISFESLEYFNQGPFGQTIEAFEQTDLGGERIVVIENRKLPLANTWSGSISRTYSSMSTTAWSRSASMELKRPNPCLLEIRSIMPVYRHFLAVWGL